MVETLKDAGSQLSYPRSDINFWQIIVYYTTAEQRLALGVVLRSMLEHSRSEDVRSAMRREGSRQDYDCLSCRVMGARCLFLGAPASIDDAQEPRHSLVLEDILIGPDTDNWRHEGPRSSNQAAKSACQREDWVSRGQRLPWSAWAYTGFSHKKGHATTSEGGGAKKMDIRASGTV